MIATIVVLSAALLGALFVIWLTFRGEALRPMAVIAAFVAAALVALKLAGIL